MLRFVRGRGAAALLAIAAIGLSGCPGETPSNGPANGGSVASNGDGGPEKAVEPYPVKVSKNDPPTVAYVTNGIASFWKVAEAGARKAADEFNCKVEVRMPPSDDGVGNQKRMMEELVAIGVDGIAVSPIDAANQLQMIDSAAAATNLITHDSDAPRSRRIAYVGTSNYEAGRMVGEMVREALPDGGSVMIFIGRLEQDNAIARRLGVMDGVLGRPADPNRPPEDPGVKVTVGKYTVLGTRTDLFNDNNAKAQAEDAIATYPDLGCMVGLFSYNPPILLEAIKAAEKVGKIKVVAFDEAPETLQAIIDGTCVGTVVQDPYNYGYHSVRILAGMARGDESVLPPDRKLIFPARKIVKSNVEEFWKDLKEKLGEQ